MLSGLEFVTTIAPDKMEVSPFRLTATFFGPSAVVPEIETSILALVDATAEIRPPKQFVVTFALQLSEGVPRTMPGAEGLNPTPEVMSSPPSVNIPLSRPRGNRTPKAGRVRFSPVALCGSVWISIFAVPFPVTLTVRAAARLATLPA